MATTTRNSPDRKQPDAEDEGEEVDGALGSQGHEDPEDQGHDAEEEHPAPRPADETHDVAFGVGEARVIGVGHAALPSSNRPDLGRPPRRNLRTEVGMEPGMAAGRAERPVPRRRVGAGSAP